jgi:hypothetical protein
MPNSGRSRLRERAVVALLQEPTIESAAQVTGIGLRTLQRWLTDATFQESLRKAKCDALQDATGKLRMAAGRAVAVLDHIANNRRASYAARVTAARAIIEMGLEAHTIEEQDARILALELQGSQHAEKIRFT